MSAFRRTAVFACIITRQGKHPIAANIEHDRAPFVIGAYDSVNRFVRNPG
jgi:hypothetical protein